MTTDEYKAAQVLAEAVNNKSFVPTVFGLALANDHPSRLNDVMAAFVGVVHILSERDGKIYNPINDQALRLASRIRELLTDEYGEWPPPLD